MQGIVVRTNNTAEIMDFAEPLYKTIGEVVGGFIEVVRPRGLEDPMIMIVNESGLVDGLPINPFGSIVYGFLKHKQPIMGDVVIMTEGVDKDGERDIIGFEDDEADFVLDQISTFLRDIDESKPR